MKIIIASPEFCTIGGGIAAFSRELAIALRTLGSELHLHGKHDHHTKWEEFRVSGAAGFPRQFQTAAFATQLLAGCVRSRPDLLICTHPNFAPVARIAQKIVGQQYMIVAHGIDVKSEPSFLMRTGVSGAISVLVVSDWTRQRAIELWSLDPERISILPNTFDPCRFTVADPSSTLRARHGLSSDERVVLTVGRLDASEGYKGYDRLVLALPAIREACGKVRLFIIGKGDDASRVNALIDRLGLKNSVTLTGFVPESELADYYRMADVFAMPSTGEGFGIVFLESMGCGTPVLGGAADGSVDALDKGRLGLLVNPQSVDSIADGVISLLKKSGPKCWFNRNELRNAVIAKFGRESFKARVAEILLHNVSNA